MKNEAKISTDIENDAKISKDIENDAKILKAMKNQMMGVHSFSQNICSSQKKASEIPQSLCTRNRHQMVNRLEHIRPSVRVMSVANIPIVAKMKLPASISTKKSRKWTKPVKEHVYKAT